MGDDGKGRARAICTGRVPTAQSLEESAVQIPFLLKSKLALHTIKPMLVTRYFWKGNYASLTCVKTENS